MTKAELYKKANSLPLLPGIYIMKDRQGNIIYVGKAKRLRTRVSQYFREGQSHDEKVSKMVETAYEFDTIVTSSEFEALVLECSQIKLHKPKYNVLLKDDKGYSYIRLTKGDWPRLSAERNRDGDGEYVGPFMSGFVVKQMVAAAMDSFLLPRCNRRFPEDIGKGRPCLYRHIGKCMGVCTGRIKQQDYKEAAENAMAMVKNGKGEITAMLQGKMEAAAENLEFERAALIRDQINAIEKVSAGQTMIISPEKEQDVIAFAGAAGTACGAILRFRDGRLVDKREFIFNNESNLDSLREEFLPRYYLDGDEDIPKVIAIDELFPDYELLMRLFSEKKGAKVRIYSPERGENKQLVGTAYVNASERLAQDSGLTRREEKVLSELSGLLGLSKLPEVIESYDISNWGDGSSVCGMVVFEDGKPKKSGYRRFRIKSVYGTDDYASMAEALLRRAAEYDSARDPQASEKVKSGQFAKKPDLILLDGGKGQVSVVAKVLSGTGLSDVPLFGMVKDNRHRTRGIVGVDGGEIAVSMHRGVFTFISSIQDEVHRFAIDYQRRMAKNKAFSSGLTEIPGVGKVTAKALLGHFKTIKAVSEADVDKLMEVKGMRKSTAENIYNHYNSGKS